MGPTAESVSAGLFAGPVEDPSRYWVEPADVDRVQLGGEGLVYRARRRGSDDVVALKVLAGTPMVEFDLLAERAGVFVGLRSRTLMQQIETFVGCALTATPADVVPDDFDVPYSVAVWVDGIPIAGAIEAASARQKLAWIADTAEAVVSLHAVTGPGAPNGIVHRDIKPSNIRIASDGTAVLLDFGVARPVDVTDMTQGIGTYLWRAPEVLAGGNVVPGTASDVWGVGAVAHWMFVGEAPSLDGSNAARERIAHSRGITDLADAPAVAAHLAHLLRSSPADRPRDLHAWAVQLRRLGARRRNRTRVRRSAIVVGGLAVLLLAGFGIVRVAEEFRGSPMVTAPPQSFATTTTTTAVEAIVPVGGELVCKGPADAAIVSEPYLTHVIGDVRFRMEGETGELHCESASGQVLTIKLTALSVIFSQISCASLFGLGVQGAGDATIVWSNGVTSRAVARVDLVGGRVQLHLDVTTPGDQLSGDAALTITSGASDCDGDGIDGVNVQVDQLTFRSRAPR